MISLVAFGAAMLIVLLILGAAPAPTVRGTPDGIMLENGFRIKITLASNTTISFWEREVKPPGVDGGDAVDTSTQFNAAWKTKSPRTLKDMTNSTFKAGYDPDVYNDIVAQVNVRTTVTKTYPDGSTLAYFGYLKSFEFDELFDGVFPVANGEIVPTNYDPVSHTEQGPVLTSVSGT